MLYRKNKMNYSNNIPFIAGNWKLYKTIPEALDLAREISSATQESKDAEMVVIPPFTALSTLQNILSSTRIKIGAQDVYWEDSGAYTGEISAPLLKDAGCSYVVIGHSERRQYFGETNTTVNNKVKASLKHDLGPILCCGETLEEREHNKTLPKIEDQLKEGMDGLSQEDVKKVIFAYEPIWAIGTGLTATPDQAQEIHAFIRNNLREKYGNETASCAIILYGGSVKPDNAFSLIKEKDINGALIGGASLKAGSFIEITKEAIRAYKEKQ